MNSKVALRFKLLKSEIEELNKCHQDTLRDPWVDCGMQYDRPTPYNEESIKIHNELLSQGLALIKKREEDLFGKIFHFSQTFFSLKDYLKKLYPQYEGIVEDFFSNEIIDGITRKKIGNDLKHNPEYDLELKKRKPEITKLGTKQIITIHMEGKWYYNEIDSVKHCNTLFSELSEFLEKNNF